MTLALIDKIIELLERGILVGTKIFDNIDIDLVLEKRDSDPFDSDWMDAFNEIEKEFRNILLGDEVNIKISRVRELAFKNTFKITSYGELAGYVSDDFELISKAIVSESKNKWIASLLYCYLYNGFPCGQLELQSLEINKII